MYAYTEADSQRLAPETPKGQQYQGAAQDLRQDFDRDRARVLHSAALRRLADKTQVVSPHGGDTPRTRLTHSLEVAQIARGIAQGVGADPNLAELAGLSHDIGHPPYGHNGEKALNTLAADCGGFEGNAQTLRILTRLEPKILAGTPPVSVGLNLTRASLDAVCKYPWTPDHNPHKYSAYAEDADLLAWIRDGARPGKKSVEAQIMDISDDIAYSVHDVEDGILSARISLGVLWDLVELAELAHKGAKAFGHNPDALIDAADRLRALPEVAATVEFDGSLAGLAALKRMTSTLVGRYITGIIGATSGRPLGRHHGDITIPADLLAEITLLKSVAVLYVMDERSHLRAQRRDQERIFRVADYLVAGAPDVLDPLFAGWWCQAESEAGRLRVVIDQLASMTESRLARLDRMVADMSRA